MQQQAEVSDALVEKVAQVISCVRDRYPRHPTDAHSYVVAEAVLAAVADDLRAEGREQVLTDVERMARRCDDQYAASDYTETATLGDVAKGLRVLVERHRTT
jgi:hypothetical protein